MRAISEKQRLDIKLLVGAGHAQSFAMLREGKADAFATDDVLLYGLVATTGSGDRYHVVGEYLSYDPNGLMYRNDDPDFAAIVDRSFSHLAQSRELVDLYNKWFQQRLPTGETLDLPMSPQLEEIFRVEGYRINPPRIASGLLPVSAVGVHFSEPTPIAIHPAFASLARAARYRGPTRS